ncbi:lysozyme [Vibrio sp. La 4.2.2]|uniref:lysozyme n=1 Tax=Vibrio sp. La 4.2.2 TaxID=2998830 RepID=UPI0022CDEE78|nr:lysozyme [Vibrio sp. La 4.2.2]MDA0107839.1 lysozyme [Vibrio sp. La 4.2.2]
MTRRKRITCSVGAVIALLLTGIVPNDVKLSHKGLALIGNAEQCRLTPYVCPAGHITNGIGNTHHVPNDVIPLAQVAQDWARNIEAAQHCLEQALPNTRLTQGQYDAFTSFIFNTGCARFQFNQDGSKTQIYQHITAGNYTAACHQLRRWVYGGGVKLKGLIIRRQKETALCLSD